MARSDLGTEKSSLTVILPCAGEGSRLGLTYPKPLYEVHSGLGLIDLSLMHLRLAHHRGFGFQVAVVVRPGTMAVYDYVKKALPGITVHSCPYKPAYPEWPGSVYSAQAWFAENNLVLLPDSIITLGSESHFYDARGRCLVEALLQGLGNHPVHVLCVRETREILRRMGAVHLEKGHLTLLCDKPRGELSAYNGFWVSYAFRADQGEGLYHYLRAAVSGQKEPFPLSRLGPPGADWAWGYRDLGTWEALESFRGEHRDAQAFWADMATQAGMNVCPVTRQCAPCQDG